jgi:hypothetical protein
VCGVCLDCECVYNLLFLFSISFSVLLRIDRDEFVCERIHVRLYESSYHHSFNTIETNNNIDNNNDNQNQKDL